jgi:hypothetical protein
MARPRKYTDAEVAEYWLTHDSVEAGAWKGPPVRLEFDPGVERPTHVVTLHLPRRLLQDLKGLAKGRDIPYQSLIERLLADKVTELRRKPGSMRKSGRTRVVR